MDGFFVYTGREGIASLQGSRCGGGEQRQRDAIRAGADDLGLDHDGAVGVTHQCPGALEREHDECAGIPAVLGQKVESRRADIADTMPDWSATAPIMGDELEWH